MAVVCRQTLGKHHLSSQPLPRQKANKRKQCYSKITFAIRHLVYCVEETIAEKSISNPKTTLTA